MEGQLATEVMMIVALILAGFFPFTVYEAVCDLDAVDFFKVQHETDRIDLRRCRFVV